MRRFTNIITLLCLLCTTLVSCGGGSDDPVTDLEFKAGPSSLVYTADGGELKISVQTSQKPTVSSDASWLTFGEAQASGTKGTLYSIAVTAAANTVTSARTATITVKSGSNSATIAVSQAAYEDKKTDQETTPTTYSPIDPDQTGMTKTAKQIAADIYAGVNIGNTMESIVNGVGGETYFGNPLITESYVKALKEKGFNAVRLPVSWAGHLSDKSTYTISETWLNRVKEVVGYCVNNGMYVIVNIHWDGGWLEDNITAANKDAVNKEQKALWTQIAYRLRDYDEHLLFAGCNEPNVSDATGMAILKEFEQTFVDAVRATGGRNYYRTLVIQGPKTDIVTTNDLFGSMPTDKVADRLMAEIHYYSPSNFCILEADASWGKMFYFWGEGNHVSGSDRNANYGEESDMLKWFGLMKTKFVDKGIPVIMGEYGALVSHDSVLSGDQLKAHRQSRYDWNMKVTRDAKNYGMVPFLWETGGFINRNTGAVIDQYVVPAVLAGAKEGKYPY
jgi:aryl-phospho-beta-D-glucosidase BglC (GH1 family)